MRVGATRHWKGVAQLLRPQRKDGPETEVLSPKHACRVRSTSVWSDTKVCTERDCTTKAFTWHACTLRSVQNLLQAYALNLPRPMGFQVWRGRLERRIPLARAPRFSGLGGALVKFDRPTGVASTVWPRPAAGVFVRGLDVVSRDLSSIPDCFHPTATNQCQMLDSALSFSRPFLGPFNEPFRISGNVVCMHAIFMVR